MIWPDSGYRRDSPIQPVMERGLYIAATGMLSDIVRQDVIAANLANVNTVGYKGDRVVNESFSELFLTNLQNGRPEGGISLGTHVAGIYSDLAQGAFRNTGNGYDAAIAGEGFFMIRTPTGIQYTRNGEFSRSTDGYLVTQQGNFVLDSNKQPIYVGDSNPVIRTNGEIVGSNGAIIGSLGIVTLDADSLRKIGQNNWTGTETGGQPANTMIRQGFLEMSSVNSVKEMVDMINVLRSYESAQRAMTSIDGTLDKAVNSVGVVG